MQSIESIVHWRTQRNLLANADLDENLHVNCVQLGRAISCWDPLSRNLRIDLQFGEQSAFDPADNTTLTAQDQESGHSRIGTRGICHQGGTATTVLSSSPSPNLSHRTTHEGEDPASYLLETNEMVDGSECALLTGITAPSDLHFRCESLSSSSEDDHESVLGLKYPGPTFTPAYGSTSSLAADHPVSRTIPSSTLFGQNIFSPSNPGCSPNHKPLIKRNNMLKQNLERRRSEKSDEWGRAAKLGIDIDELEFLPSESLKPTTIGDEQDAEVGAQQLFVVHQQLDRDQHAQHSSPGDRSQSSKDPCVGFERHGGVLPANDLVNQMGVLLEYDKDEDRETAVRDIIDTYLAINDDYPSTETYSRAVKRNRCEWRRKREEEKGVARRIFKSPSDWTDAMKLNNFLIESRRIWA